jgi:hypothetical protein
MDNLAELYDMMENIDIEHDDTNYLVETISTTLKNIYRLEKHVEKKKERVIEEIFKEKNIDVVEEPQQKGTFPIVKHKNQVRTDIQKDLKHKPEPKVEKKKENSPGSKDPSVESEPESHESDSDSDTEIESEPKTPRTKLLRKLYRKIASHYHPDKCKHKYKHRFFHYVNKGNESKNVVMLVYLIHRFELSDILNLDEENIAVMRSELSVLKSREKQLSVSLFNTWDTMDPHMKAIYKSHIRNNLS